MWSVWWRRMALVTALACLFGPADDAAWHHRLAGVVVTTVACWVVAIVVVRD